MTFAMTKSLLWVGSLVLVLSSQIARSHEAEPPADVRTACLSATDLCRVCRLDTGGKVTGCSLPGIACVPEAWRCNAPVAQSQSTANDLAGGSSPIPPH